MSGFRDTYPSLYDWVREMPANATTALEKAEAERDRLAAALRSIRGAIRDRFCALPADRYPGPAWEIVKRIDAALARAEGAAEPDEAAVSDAGNREAAASSSDVKTDRLLFSNEWLREKAATDPDDEPTAGGPTPIDWPTAYAEALRQRDALTADANRYRWLRSRITITNRLDPNDAGSGLPDELDKLVDLSRTAAPGVGT